MKTNTPETPLARKTLASEALSVFKQPPEKLNCAQAVLYAARDAGHTTLPVEHYRSAGGGKAPDGTCGALYAALSLSGESEQERIENEFKAQAGGTQCRIIRKQKLIRCEQCVETAATLLDRCLS